MIVTQEWLFSLMTMPKPYTVKFGDVVGIVSSIEREDGSGKSFNVTLNTTEGKKTVYCRTK